MAGAQLLQPHASPEIVFISAVWCQLGAKCLALLVVNGDGEVATGWDLEAWLTLYSSLQSAKEGESHLTPCPPHRDAHEITLSLGTDV